MTVVPFRRRDPEPEPLAFAIGARIDLRVGALAGGVIRARAPANEAFAYSNLARLLRAARMTWLERGHAHAPLTLALPAEAHGVEADLLSEAATEAGSTRRTLTFELCERSIVAGAGALADDLRARGWRLALRGDAECPLPFGARARALYAELVIEAPEGPAPFLALESGDASLLGRRLLAAKGAGLTVCAAHVRDGAHARMLAMAGFDRGGGPYAEGVLR